MAKDVLSQSEIESIISALGTGDLLPKQQDNKTRHDKKMNLYDFKRPNKFSKEQIRTLKNIHENFARMLTNFLTAYLRMPATVKLESISQVTYEEFIYSLPLPTLVTIFRLSDTNGSAILETNSFFTYPIIDILFGGEGKLIKKTRELTEIELSVMRRVNEKILNNLSYAWEDIAHISPQIDSLDTNPQFSQLLVSNEAVALISFSARIAGNDGYINLCLPYITLEPILTQLSSQNWYARQSKTEWDATRALLTLEKKIKVTEIELTAVLGRTTISVSEFLNFEEGDIILLDSQIDKPVDLCLEGKTKFRINLGTVGTKMAGVITEIINEEEGRE
ncbi:MAG: flagellar motor switch protein FliM [Dethiobacter sp.]|jgi:flagellar motor switch protein FliM|nr:flagellar motor switch protein FliM [Dethiobacter sp.]